MHGHFEMIVRWLHVWAGIIWIGHLYFFNFVNIPLQGSLDDATKKLVNPQLMPRALWWFRWGAMLTFLAGLVLFTMNFMYMPGGQFGPNIHYRSPDGLTTRAAMILMGMLFGTIMWFNVWFIIWPTQKKLLTGQVPADEIPARRALAAKFSRVNTYLSGPMLFGMLGAQHAAVAGPATYGVFIAIGLAAAWVAYFHAGKVGKLT